MTDATKDSIRKSRQRTPRAFGATAGIALCAVLWIAGCSERDSIAPPDDAPPETGSGTLALSLDLSVSSAGRSDADPSVDSDPPASPTGGARGTLQVSIAVTEIQGDGTEIPRAQETREIDESQATPTFELGLPLADQVRIEVEIVGARQRGAGSTGSGLLHFGERVAGPILPDQVTQASLSLADRVPSLLLLQSPPNGYRLQWSPVAGATRYRVRKTVDGAEEEFTTTGLDSLFVVPPSLRGRDARAQLTFRARAEFPDGRTSAFSEEAIFQEPGPIPPAEVTDLTVVRADPDQVLLSWTAPGDDGRIGRAMSYDLRYDVAPITDASFEVTSPVTSVPAPSDPGRTEFLAVEGLDPETTYYFALKTADEAPNSSGLSNVASVTTPALPDLSAPAAIQDLSAGVVGESTVRLTWSSPADDGTDRVASYEIRYDTEPLAPESFVAGIEVTGAPEPAGAGATETIELTDLDPAVYYFAIRSRDAAGNSSPVSNIVSVDTQDTRAPAGVVDLAAEVDGSRATLRWTASGDNDREGRAHRYELRLAGSPIDATNFDQATPVESPPEPATSGSAESFVIEGLRAERTYHFALRVRDESDNASVISNLATIATTDFEAPARTLDLRSEEVTGTRAELFWTAPGDNQKDGQASGYDLRFSEEPITDDNFETAIPVGGIDELVPQPAGSAESVLLVASEDVQVHLAMRSVDEVGNLSALSNTVFVRFGDDAPQAPADLTATAAGPTEIDLSFTDTALDEDFFEVERRAESSPSFERVATIERGLAARGGHPTLQIRLSQAPITDMKIDTSSGGHYGVGGETVTYRDTGLEERTTYVYRVRAHNGGGPSAYSGEASARTAIGAPSGLSASGLDDSSIRLSWSFGDDPDGFELQRLEGADWTTIADVSGDRRNHEDTSLEPASEHRYRVRAYEAGEESPYSDEATGSTGETPPRCHLSLNAVEFGTVPIGETTIETVRVENRGGGRLIGAVSHDCEHFVTDGTVYDLGAGESTLIAIGFRPRAAGQHLCEVYVGTDCDPIVVIGVGETAPLCALDVANLDFGGVQVGTTEEISFHLTNVGGGTLRGELSLICSDAFRITRGAGEYALEQDESLEVRIAFSPTQEGGEECGLLTGSDHCNGVIVSGLGEPGPRCEFLERPIDFGAVLLGTPAARRVILTNTGQGVLTGSLSVDCGSNFQLSGTLDFSLQPGQAHLAVLSFEPTRPSDYLCIIDAGDICGSVEATGLGVLDQPCRLDQQDGLDFGVVETGSRVERSFQIENSSTESVSLDPFLSPRCPPDVFAVTDGGGPQTIPPGGVHSVTVEFSPQNPGQSYVCHLYLGAEECPSVELRGEAENLPCTIEGSGDFGTVLVGETYERAYRIINYGEGTLTGAVSMIGSSSVTSLVSGNGSYSLQPFEAHAFTVRFDPIVGDYRAVVLFGNTSCQELEITGRGELPEPACSIQGDASFEAILGQTVSETLTVINGGNTDLSLNLTLGAGSQCGPFRITQGAGRVDVPPGEIHKFVVAYTPTVSDFHVCALRLGDEACGTLTLLGVVLPPGD